MKISEKDLSLIRQLGIKNVLDLALLIPKGYDDFTLTNEISVGKNTTLQINITSQKITGKLLLINAYATNIQSEVQLVIFNHKKWHFGAFGTDKDMLINGKLTSYNGLLQMSNPKIIKDEKITPKYGIKGIKDSDISKLIDEYLSQNIDEIPLENHLKNLLLNIHANDENSVKINQNYEQIKDDIKFIEIYNHLYKLSKKKLVKPSVSVDTKSIDFFIKSLPFSLTQDQLNAINDIRLDLQNPLSTRRVVMGDVGCGKTMVILSAALMCEKSILLVPTSILCDQIYDEAIKYLPKDFNIVKVKSSTSTKEQKLIDEKLKDANFIIGTHALLYKDLPKAQLVMIDEQHRFGSSQRQKINENDSYTPHFVQFSATPIPRTLAMIQSEMVQFSFIKQMPFKKDITTICLEGNAIKIALNHIKEEIKKGNQALIIYPLVNASENSSYTSLEEAKDYYYKNFENVYVTHGKDKDKDKTLLEFRERGDLLISTSVVEVGISLPRLSVIIIVGAERFGLASLHQMRGRVGRTGLSSFCYLYSKQKTPQRLHEFANTLDGFIVAELDLKNRNSGDLVDGKIQHGEQFKFFNLSEDEAILNKAKKYLKSIQNN